jgi:DNA polymerase III gamma/tau subunit
VVRRLADKNPQKLRQIGMNYDIANAKGVIEISEEEKKKKDAKAKEAKEKKIKEKEEADKEKSDFQLWKKEKKAREEKDDAKPENEKVAAPTKSDETKTHDSLVSTQKDAIDEPTTAEKKVEAPEVKAESASLSADMKAVKSEPESDSSNGDGKDTPATGDDSSPKVSAPPVKGDTEDVLAYGAGPGNPPSGDGGDAAPQPAANAPPPAENKQNPWNAVCVLGLRVYSQDAEVSIKLVKPKNASEGAVLDADGATQAGATM